MNNRLLSNSELEYIKELVDKIQERVTDSIDEITTVLQSFSNEEIVNSFYSSGKFGKTEQTKIEQINKALTNFTNELSSPEGLIPITKSYVERQIELNNMGR